MLLWVLLTVSSCNKLKRSGQTLKEKKIKLLRDHDYNEYIDYGINDDVNDNINDQRDTFSLDVPFWEAGPCSTGEPGCSPKRMSLSKSLTFFA